jgi:hypothetical protein
MMKATNKFPLEISVIHGTLRNQDLIPAFLEAVLQLDPDTPIPEELREAPQDNDDHEWWYTETAYWVLEHLDNKLNDHAPDGYYFGAHDGDGSDFGFWRMIDEERMEKSGQKVLHKSKSVAEIKQFRRTT